MIAIKDDIIPELYQDRIYSMMTNTVFPWTFLQDVTYREQDIVKNINANANSQCEFHKSGDGGCRAAWRLRII